MDAKQIKESQQIRAYQYHGLPTLRPMRTFMRKPTVLGMNVSYSRTEGGYDSNSVNLLHLFLEQNSLFSSVIRSEIRSEIPSKIT